MSISESKREWYPGSFTKNFSWGPSKNGLRALYESIRVGFDNKFEDVERDIFVQRISTIGRPFQIPTNFFLFNEIRDGKSYLVADELVFQAIEFEYSDGFDKLALIAFLLSLAGRWKGAYIYQRWPSLWAKFFVIDKVAEQGWNGVNFDADVIQSYIAKDPRYTAKTSRKVATNLNHMLDCVKLPSLDSKRVEQWWVSSIFLVLDRVIRDRLIDGIVTTDSDLNDALIMSKFGSLSGPRSLEKELATPHIIELYRICGREKRFDPETVQHLTGRISNSAYRPNQIEPVGAAHPSNYRIKQLLPRMCALLAMYAGFVTFEIEETEELSSKGFIQKKLAEVLEKLKEFGIRPTMSVAELMKITRDK
jgi:hypothetical protein